jgi:hypothetical protein
MATFPEFIILISSRQERSRVSLHTHSSNPACQHSFKWSTMPRFRSLRISEDVRKPRYVQHIYICSAYIYIYSAYIYIHNIYIYIYIYIYIVNFPVGLSGIMINKKSRRGNTSLRATCKCSGKIASNWKIVMRCNARNYLSHLSVGFDGRWSLAAAKP